MYAHASEYYIMCMHMRVVAGLLFLEACVGGYTVEPKVVEKKR